MKNEKCFDEWQDTEKRMCALLASLEKGSNDFTSNSPAHMNTTEEENLELFIIIQF